MKEILLRKVGDSKKLGERCGVSQPTVRMALRGETKTGKARLIRATAINAFGAVEVEKDNSRISH